MAVKPKEIDFSDFKETIKQPAKNNGLDFSDFETTVKKKEPIGGNAPSTFSERSEASQFVSPSISPSKDWSAIETKNQRHEVVASEDAELLLGKYKITSNNLKNKSEFSPFITDKIDYYSFEQSREAKTGKVIDDVLNKGKFRFDDIDYLVKAAPTAAKQIIKTFVPDVKPGQEFLPENITKMVNNGEKVLSELTTEQKILTNKQRDLEVKKNLTDFGIDIDQLYNPTYSKNITSEIQAKKQIELTNLDNKFPIEKVQKVSGRTGYYVDERQNRKQYEIEKARIDAKYKDIQNNLGLNYAFDYAKQNPTKSPKEIGEQWYKYADPDSYKLWEKAGKKGGSDKDIAQVGINALYGSEKAGTSQLAKKDEEMIDDQYPDQIIAETRHRLGAELYKGENWFLNASPSTQELDKAAQQLPQKNREVYYKYIRDEEKRNVGTNIPMSGLLNKIGEGFGAAVLETGKFVGDITGIRTEKEQAEEAVNQQYDTKYHEVGEYNPAVQRLSTLNKKQNESKLTPDEVHEKQDLESFTNVKSTGQTLLDGTGNLTGQVLFQAIGTKGLGTVLGSGVKTLGLLKTEASLAGLTSEEIIAQQAVNFGITKPMLTNIAADAIAFGSSYDAAKVDALRLMPDDKDSGKRLVYANIVAGLNAATERIFKDEKVLNAFNTEISPNIKALVEKLSEKDISKEALAPAISNILKNSASFAKHAVIENTKESVEEVASSVGQSIATAILAPAKFNATDAFNDATSTFTSMFANGGLIAGMAGLHSHRASHIGIPAFSKLGVDERLTNDVRGFINNQVLQGNFTPEEGHGKLAVIDAAASVNTVIMPQVRQLANLSEKAHGKYGMQLLNEKILKTKIETANDEVLKNTLEKKVKESENIRKDILNKELFVDDNYNIRTLDEIHNDIPKGLIKTEEGAFAEKNIKKPEDIESDLKQTVHEKVAKRAEKEVREFYDNELFPSSLTEKEKQDAVRHPLDFLNNIAKQANTIDIVGGQPFSARSGTINYFGEDLVDLAEDIFPKQSNEQNIIKQVGEHGTEELKRTMESFNAEGKQDEGIQHLKERSLEEPNNLKKELGRRKNLTIDIIAENSPTEIDEAIRKKEKELKKENIDPEKSEEINKHISLLEAGLEKAHAKINSLNEQQNKVPDTQTGQVAPIEETNKTGQPAAETKNDITQEAKDLIGSIREGSKPAFVTKNIEKIAKDNGIEVTDKTTPDDIVAALQKKKTDFENELPFEGKPKVRVTAQQVKEGQPKLKPEVQKLSNELNKLFGGNVALEGENKSETVSVEQLGIKPTDSIIEVLDKLIAHNGDFSEILKFLKGLPDIEQVKFESKYLRGKEGEYVPKSNLLEKEESRKTVRVNPKAENAYYALTHELLHFLTLDSETVTKFGDKKKISTLQDIYNFIKTKKEFSEQYGLKNFTEFMAELPINSDLRKEVSDVIATEKEFKDALGQSKSVLEYIYDFIKEIIEKLFGSSAHAKEIDFDKPLIDNAVKIATDVFFAGQKVIPEESKSWKALGIQSAELKNVALESPALGNTERDKKINDFVKEKLQEGYSRSDIKEALIDNGIGEKEANEFVTPEGKEYVRTKIPETKERSFSERVSKDQNILPSARAGIEKTKNYLEQTNALSAKEAEVILDRFGEDESFIFVTQNDKLKPAVRVVLGQAVIKKYNQLASDSQSEVEQNYYIDKTISVATYVSEKLGTEAGQMIQAFSLWDRLSPEAQLRSAVKDAKEIGKKKVAKSKKNIDAIGSKLQKANEETVDELEQSAKVKKSVKNADTKRVKKAKDKIQAARDKRAKLIEKFKKESRGGITLSTGGLTKEGIEFVGELAKTYIDEGIAQVQLVAEKVLQQLKELGVNVNPDVEKEVNDISDTKLAPVKDRNLKSAISNLEKEVNKIIREHYTIPSEERKSLVNKFIERAGLDTEEAKEMAKDIQEEFDRIATRKKEKILADEKSRFDKIHKRLSDGKIRDKRAVQDEMIRYSNLGALTDEEFAEMVAEKLGTGKLSPEHAKEITRLANKIEKAPEGEPKRNATEDLLAYRASISKTSWGEVAQGVWYANVLSGYGTHIKNIVSTFFNGMAFFAAEAVRNPKSIPALVVGGAKGTKRGLLEAWHTLTTGRTPIHVSKIETPDILERKNFILGYLNPGNYLKFVGRLMKAEDVLQFQALKEMRATQLAYREAAKMGLSNPFSKAVWNKINDTLLNTKERMEDAEAQVKEEGLKGKERKRRMYELLENSRPVQMTEAAYGFAAKGTFNHETEGTLGALTNGISHALDLQIGGVRPLRFFIPFTRIITNVLNNSLDFSPIGFVRAARGERGFESFEKYRFSKGAHKELTKEERHQLIAKASLGVGLTAALYALTKIPCGDDGKPCIDITGPGTGDYKRDLQLKQNGWQAYSIKVGNKYYSYKLTPMFINIAYIGNMNDHEKYGTHADDETLLQKVALAGWQSGKDMADMTWIGSASSLLGAFNETNPTTIGKRVESVLANSAKSFIIPNLYTQTAQKVEQIFDLPQKDAHGFYEQLIQDIPVVRNSLNDKLNALGEPVVRDVDILLSKEKKDPVWQYLIDKGGWVAPVNKNSVIIFDGKIEKDRPITDDEYYEFSKARGKRIKESIQNLMENGANVNSEGKVTSSDEDVVETKDAKDLTSKELKTLIKAFSAKASKETKKEMFEDESETNE